MEEAPALPDDVLELGRRLIPAPVFLVGCARSGTSILGEALAAHPGIDYVFEASDLWNAAVSDRDDHRLESSDATPDVARSIYPSLARRARESRNDEGGRTADARVLLEKNPKHVLRIAFLDALFPWGLFVHLIRDGRDTVASLMFRNRGDRWGHLETPGWRELLVRFPAKNHIRCAHQWRDAVATARREGSALGADRYLEVRYEALLAEPGRVLREILAFVGLPAHPRVDAFLPRIQDATARSYHARRQVRHYVENHSRRIGRYRENLSAEELGEVQGVCGDLLRELGYDEPA